MVLPVSPVRSLSILNGEENGRLPASILTSIPGQAGGATITLVHPAARAFKALIAEAKKAGHILKANGTTYSYRTYAEQSAIFMSRYVPYYTRHTDGHVSYRYWNGRRWYHKSGPVVAVPGQSNHGWARAVDMGEQADSDAGAESFDTPTLNWLKANEQRFGISHEIQSEPWHIRYFAGDVPPPAVLAYEASLEPDPEPEPDPEEEEMQLIYVYFMDNRSPTGQYTRIARVSEIPLVSGVHLYAISGVTASIQTPESLAGARALAAFGIGKPPHVVGSSTNPQTIVTAQGKQDPYFALCHMLDGPLAGIKK